MLEPTDPHLQSIQKEIRKHEQIIERINSKIDNLLQTEFPEVAQSFMTGPNRTTHKKINPPIILSIGGIFIGLLPIIVALTIALLTH